MILSLKNYHLEVIGKVLATPMPFQKGRIKMRFLKLLQDKQEICNKSRLEILSNLADKDENGKPILEKQQYKLSPENLEKFQQEFLTLMNEECLVDVPESMKGDVGTIRSLIIDSQAVLDNRETVIIEEVLEVLKPEAKPQIKK